MAVRRRAFEYVDFHGRVSCFQQRYFVALQRIQVGTGWCLCVQGSRARNGPRDHGLQVNEFDRQSR